MPDPKKPTEPPKPDPLEIDFHKVDDEFELDLDLPAVARVLNSTIKADSGNTLPGKGPTRSRHIVLASHVDVENGRLVGRIRVRGPAGREE